MTTVRATCNDCGDISTSHENITLILIAGKDEGGFYRFICPQCSKIVLKPATLPIVTLLRASGISTITQDLPLELLERPREDIVPPINLDDVLDLGLALQDDQNVEDWITNLSRGESDERGTEEDFGGLL